MSTCRLVSVFLLVIINVFVTLIAAATLFAGIMLTAAPQTALKWIGPLMNSALDVSVIDQKAIHDAELIGILQSVSIPLIVISAVILIVSFCGCCGALTSSKWLMAAFATFMSLIFLTILVLCLAGYLKRDVALPTMKKRLGVLAKEYYVNETHADIISFIFTALQTSYDCCGSSDGKDYADSTVLQRSTADQVIPISCCNDYKNKNAAQLKECTSTTPTNENISNYNYGCFKAMEKVIVVHINYILIGIGIFVVFIFIEAALGWFLFFQYRRSEPMKQV